MTSTSDHSDAPALVVLHGGDPDADELAALVVAVGALAGAPQPQPQPQRPTLSGWADRRSSLRKPLDHGPGGWVASARSSL